MISNLNMPSKLKNMMRISLRHSTEMSCMLAPRSGVIVSAVPGAEKQEQIGLRPTLSRLRRC